MTISLRPVGPADAQFLQDVYASTRATELALADWSEEQKASFVRQQFVAQTRHYRDQYPTATQDVILVDDEPAGRLYVDRRPTEIRVVDIALLPKYRGGRDREEAAERCAGGGGRVRPLRDDPRRTVQSCRTPVWPPRIRAHRRGRTRLSTDEVDAGLRPE